MRHLPLSRCGKPRTWLHAVLCFLLVVAEPFATAAAASLRGAEAAYAAGNYARAAQLFLDLASRGNPVAQARIGNMYAQGQGVPRNYYVAAMWYRCAGGQGYPPAAYMLGLLYDKGQGVPQDYVLAYTWVNLAVAGSPRHPHYGYWVNVRDSISSKMTLNERLKAEELALMGPTPNICEPLGLS